MAAFTSTIIKKPQRGSLGKLKVSYGYYLGTGGSTGGDVNTGMRLCHILLFMVKSGAVPPTVNEDVDAGSTAMNVSGKTVTIVIDANGSGRWLAIGQ